MFEASTMAVEKIGTAMEYGGMSDKLTDSGLTNTLRALARLKVYNEEASKFLLECADRLAELTDRVKPDNRGS